jgi:anti-anti-sigma factor
MTIEQVDDAHGTFVKFSGSLNISCAVPMQRALLDALHGPQQPVMDLSEVEQCDTASAQLLCSALRTAASGDRRFHVTGISEAVRQTIDILGLPFQELTERRMSRPEKE